MAIIEIESLNDPRVQCYARLTDHELRSRQRPEHALIIAESPKVIDVALRAKLEPVSLLCEHRHITGDAAHIIDRCASMPVYTGSRELLSQLTGYTLTRGVLCAMRRPPQPTANEVCRDATRIAVIANVVDSTNIGAIFRSAAALGIDAVLVTRDSCDPLNRRALRVSMGNVLLTPWAWINDPVRHVHELGFKTAALALTENSTTLDNPRLAAEQRLAIVLGAEGDGLPRQAIEDADYVVRIPMARGVDSLNVAAAGAVAFWVLNNHQKIY